MSHQLIINQVAVLGAGVMGAQIAAHLVNAGVPVILYDLAAEDGDTNAIVQKARAQLKKQDPAPLSRPQHADYIRPANYQDDLPLLTQCDLVIEAIAERLDWKQSLYQQIVPHLAEHTLLASNTSGLSINQLAAGLPGTVQTRFCGIHFFNPPRYMYLVELILCEQTRPDLLQPLETFLVSTLGKGVIYARDTPNFIANRIGVFSFLATLHHARDMNLGFDLVDALTGRYLGRPKSATFRTLDLVGLDTFAHVVSTMQQQLTDDPWHSYYQLPDWLQQRIDQGALGQKSRQGVYQKKQGQIYVFDPKQEDYRLSQADVDAGVKEILRTRDWSDKLKRLRSYPHPQAQFVCAILRDLLHYCAVLLPQIAHSAQDIDYAMRWGFGWDIGPFEIWQQSGWQQTLDWLEQARQQQLLLADVALPSWAADPKRHGVHTEQGSFAPESGRYQPRAQLPVYQRQLFPETLCAGNTAYGQTIFETETVRLWHQQDEIAILSFKSKMHVIGDETLSSIQRAVTEAEDNWRGLIIWQTEPPFSAGANLLQLMQGMQPDADKQGLLGKLKHSADRIKYTVAGGGGVTDAFHAAAGNVPDVASVVAKFQQTTQRIKYARVPVIAAVDGLALGGGCEMIMHATRVVASLESYIGLVEVGVGLLPAGGGCKEAVIRMADYVQVSADKQQGQFFPILKKYFTQIAMGEVAKSAHLAQDMGYLKPADRVVMNRHEVLHVAKQELNNLLATAYRPPLAPAGIPVAGRDGVAALKMLMVNMQEGGYISDHDYQIGCAVAETLCGGEIDSGSRVDEQWLLQLEHHHFMQLLATEKTRARIDHMLKTGKPLRN